MRFVAATLIGLIAGVIALAWIIFPYYKGMNYTSIVWQEIDVANPSLGFEQSVGYDSEQDFYWDEIVYSKAFKLEVLKELGRPLNNGGHFLPTPTFKKLITPGTKQEDDRFFLGIKRQFLVEPLSEVPSSVGIDLEAASKAFIRMIETRGVTAKAIGDPLIETNEVNTPKDIAQRIGHKILFGSMVSGWLVLYLSRKKNRPNQLAEATPVEPTENREP